MMPLKSQKGATLIEILVAILIFSIGLLAIVVAQTTGLTATQSSLHRSYAAHLSYELVDLMRVNMDEVNRAGSVFEDFDSTDHDFEIDDDCFQAGNGCTAQELAESSLVLWATQLEDSLPEGSATLEEDDGVYTLSIQWADFRTDAEAQDAAIDAGANAEDAALIAARVTSFQL